MQINLTGHNIEITQAIRAYMHEKMDRVKRHFDNLISAHIIFKVEKHHHTAEATLSVGGGPVLFAEDTQADLYAAIDNMVDKLDRQVRRHKSKVKSHSHETLPLIDVESEYISG